MPQIAELQSHPVLPAEFLPQTPEAERTAINVLPFVVVGDLDSACEQVGRAKRIKSFTPDEFPAEAQATYVPYQGNPGEDSCEFKLADFLVQDIDPQARAEAIATNIGKVMVEPSAPNVIRFTAPDGGVHQVVSRKPSVLLDWLKSKGYSSEPDEQPFTFWLSDPQPTTEIAPTFEVGPSTDLLPIPDTPAVNGRALSPSFKVVIPQEAAPIAPLMQDVPTRPRMAPVPNGEKSEDPQSEPFLPSEELLAIRHIVGTVSPDKLVNRFGLNPEAVRQAIADTMDNGRLLQAIPMEPGIESQVTGFNGLTSFVIRAAMQEVVLTNPNIDELRLSGTPEAARRLMNIAELKHHNERAAEAERITNKSTLLSETPVPTPIEVLTPRDTGRFHPVELKEVLERPIAQSKVRSIISGISEGVRSGVRRGLSTLSNIVRRKQAEA